MGKDIANSICTCQTKRKSKLPTFFEWIQLLVTFSVPVAIALYSFLQNNSEQAIALANREKDLEIARYQRAQDLQIADDQQKANILAAYESFLVSHLNRYGMILDKSPSARFVARLKTLTTVNQLDPTRKSFLIQSLFEAKLIVNRYNTTNPYGPGIISLEEADLSEISFNNRAMKYLSLPNSNLTGAIFAFVGLSCVNFYNAILRNTDFYRASVLAQKYSCFRNSSYTLLEVFFLRFSILIEQLPRLIFPRELFVYLLMICELYQDFHTLSSSSYQTFSMKYFKRDEFLYINDNIAW